MTSSKVPDKLHCFADEMCQEPVEELDSDKDSQWAIREDDVCILNLCHACALSRLNLCHACAWIFSGYTARVLISV